MHIQLRMYYTTVSYLLKHMCGNGTLSKQSRTYRRQTSRTNLHTGPAKLRAQEIRRLHRNRISDRTDAFRRLLVME